MMSRIQRPLLAAIATTLIVWGCTQQSFSQPDSAPKTEEKAAASTTTDEGGRVYRHVVMFKFKADATAEQIETVVAAFRDLPKKIPEISAFEWGTDVSPEKKSKGFTHCFLLTFKSEADLGVYLPHPDHKAFGDVLRPYLDDVLVVDYWTEK